jgi:hypothetical protein
MDEKSKKRSDKTYQDEWALKNWRAWGSWFSWGSPVGLALGYGIVMVSTGAFLWLLALANHIR